MVPAVTDGLLGDASCHPTAARHDGRGPASLAFTGTLRSFLVSPKKHEQRHQISRILHLVKEWNNFAAGMKGKLPV